MFKEFRDFILKGNMLDMAVGIIIGAAFTTVVNSMVANIILPPIGALTGGVDFSELSAKLPGKTPKLDDTGKPILSEDGKAQMVPVEIKYGKFINDIITLLIIGFCVFLLVKAYNTAKEKFDKDSAEHPDEPSDEIKLLTEIRDALKTRS